MKLELIGNRVVFVFDDHTKRTPRIEVTEKAVRIGCFTVTRQALAHLLTSSRSVGVVQVEGGIWGSSSHKH